MTHRWRQQSGAAATAQVVRLDATSLAWATVSEGTWEMRSRQVIQRTTSTFAVSAAQMDAGCFCHLLKANNLWTKMSPFVRRSWTERTARSRRSGALTAPSRRNPRRWSSNWRRRVRDGGTADGGCLHYCLCTLSSESPGPPEAGVTWSSAAVQNHKTTFPVWFSSPRSCVTPPFCFCSPLEAFSWEKYLCSDAPRSALRSVVTKTLIYLIAHQSRLHVCMCVSGYVT